MTITATTPSSAIAAAAPSKKTGMGALDQRDFLQLMTAQLRMQDPFDPVDNKEMLAQMAQFSSLSGITEINDTLKTISLKLDSTISTDLT